MTGNPRQSRVARPALAFEATLTVLAGLALVSCNKTNASSAQPELSAEPRSGPSLASAKVEANEVPAAAPSASGSAQGAKKEAEKACAPGGCAPGKCGGSAKP